MLEFSALINVVDICAKAKRLSTDQFLKFKTLEVEKRFSVYFCLRINKIVEIGRTNRILQKRNHCVVQDVMVIAIGLKILFVCL